MTVFDELSRLSLENMPQFIVISGEDEDIISELKTQLMAKLNFDPTDLSQSYFDLMEADPNLALEELESLPFFGDEMLVIFENLWDLMTAKKNIFSDKQLERLTSFLENPLASTRLVIICHGKLDGKRRIVKKLKQVAFHLEATPLKVNDLSQYFQISSKLGADIINRIIDKSNNNFAISKQNISLVKTFAEGREVTVDDVDIAVPKSLSDNIFALTDLILQEKISDARKLVSDLVLQGEDEIKLLAILTNNFRLYYQIKLLLEKHYTENQMISYLKINPYRFKFLLGPARNKDKIFLTQAIHFLIDTDFKIKTGQADKAFLMDMVLIRLSGIK